VRGGPHRASRRSQDKPADVIDLRGREHEPAVVEPLAAAQIHRAPEDALSRAPSIATKYARSNRLRLYGCASEQAFVGLAGTELGTAGAAFLRDLAVAPGQRRRGVGRALVDFLRGEAGFSAIEGHTLAAAAYFYERCGFQITADGLMPNGATRYRFAWGAV